jgi:hypothetical protein
MERWAAIEDFEDYEVSDLGRVRRKHATPARAEKIRGLK